MKSGRYQKQTVSEDGADGKAEPKALANGKTPKAAGAAGRPSSTEAKIAYQSEKSEKSEKLAESLGPC